MRTTAPPEPRWAGSRAGARRRTGWATTARAGAVLAALVLGLCAILAAPDAAWARQDDATTPDPSVRAPRAVHLLRDVRGRAIPLLAALQDGQVLELRAAGFEANHTGGVRSCLVEVPLRCGSSFPVRFDDAGAARVQHQLDALAENGTGPCEPGDRCVLEVFDGTGSAFAELSFGSVPAVDVTLRLPGGAALRAGRTFTVEVGGTTPDAEWQIVLCRSRDPFPSSCSPLRHATPPRGETLAAPVMLQVTASPSDVERCGRTGCVLSAQAGERSVRADVLEVRTATVETTARYQPVRVAGGLTLAVALLAGAGWLWRRGDWSPPPTADGSAIDQAEFADLDAEAALDEAGSDLPDPGEELPAQPGHPRRRLLRRY